MEVLPVPRGPMSSTPPIDGLMRFSTSASFISAWPTNASSQFKIGIQNDRKFSGPYTGVLSSSSIVGTLTSLSIAAAVPPNAKSAAGSLSTSTTAASTSGITVASDANNTGALLMSAGSTSTSAIGVSVPWFLDLTTAQTIYYSTSNTAGTPAFNITCSSYTF